MNNHQLIAQAAYGKFNIIPKDNDKCHGDEHLKPEISEDEREDIIKEIKQSLLTDMALRADISVDVYEDDKFLMLINTVADSLLQIQPLDACEVGRMFINLVNERYYKLAVKESGNE